MGFDSLIDRLRRPPLSSLESNLGDRNVFVSAHPISGNTWLSFLLAYCLNARFWDVDVVGEPLFNRGFSPLLGGDNEHRGSGFDRVLKTHAHPGDIPLGPADRVVCVVRDVRDVTNSYYHRLFRRWPESPDWKRRAAIAIASRAVPERIRYPFAIRYFSRRWAAHNRDAVATRALLVRYEDLLAAPSIELERLIRGLDEDAWDPAVAARAVELFSLEAMRAEAARVSAAHPVRTGGAGNWQRHYSDADRRWMAREHGALLTELGYRVTP